MIGLGVGMGLPHCLQVPRPLLIEHGRSELDKTAQSVLNVIGCGGNVDWRIDNLACKGGLDITMRGRLLAKSSPRVFVGIYYGVAPP